MDVRVKALKDFAGHHVGDVFSVSMAVADAWQEGGFVELISAKPKAPAEPPKAPAFERAGPIEPETETGGEPAGEGDK